MKCFTGFILHENLPIKGSCNLLVGEAMSHGETAPGDEVCVMFSKQWVANNDTIL